MTYPMTSALDLKLNPNLDPAPFAAAYQRSKLVSIPNVFAEETAEAIHQILGSSLSWRLVFPEPDPSAPNGETVAQLTRADIQALGPQAMNTRIKAVMARARDNFGYLYNAYPMITAYLKGWDQGHPIHRLTEFLNSPEFLEFGRAVVGAQAITKADAQATLYTGGNFLTRHIDEGYDKERRAAYTFGFTKHWEPDWGGLLMFLDSDLNVSKALLPRFNTLNLFDGTMMHTVSAVSPFAGGQRLQVTGWLRDDPPANPS